MENLDASEIHARRLNAKEVLTSKQGRTLVTIADGTAKRFGRDHGVREPTLRRDQPVMREDLKEELQGNSERSQPTETKDDAEAHNDFWSMERDFIFRHHVEPRVQLFVPREETFPTPQKYIDVTRSTHTNLDGENPCRVHVVWGAPDEDSSNYRTRLLVARNLVRNVISCLQEEQEWASQRPKLDTARKLRGICCIDPEDGGSDGGSHALQDGNEEPSQQAAGNRMYPQHRKDKACMHRGSACTQSMRARESVWNLIYQKIIKITSRRKGSIR